LLAWLGWWLHLAWKFLVVWLALVACWNHLVWMLMLLHQMWLAWHHLVLHLLARAKCAPRLWAAAFFL
jgi:hypothetical protein